MSFIKVIVLLLALTTIVCNSGKLFDKDFTFTEQTLGFLEDIKVKAAGAPVNVSQCLDKPILQITKMTVDPKEIIKGSDIRIKVVGIMLSEQTVSKLHLDTYYNNDVIYTEDVDKKNVVVKKGTYGFDYTASVPSFTPAGNWEIFLNLLNAAGDTLSCVKATFIMP
jgi:hypothetical protein